MKRSEFIKGIVLATAAGVSPRLVASGTTLAAPDMAKGAVRPGKLPVVEHDVDLCVVGGVEGKGSGTSEYVRVNMSLVVGCRNE